MMIQNNQKGNLVFVNKTVVKHIENRAVISEKRSFPFKSIFQQFMAKLFICRFSLMLKRVK